MILCESKVDTNGSGCDPVGNSGSSGNLCGILGTGVEIKEKRVKVTEKHNAPSEHSDSLRSHCVSARALCEFQQTPDLEEKFSATCNESHNDLCMHSN